MGLREVLVRITGSESVSDAAKKAEGGLSGLNSKVSAIAKGIAGLVAGGALAAFFKSSVGEAIKAEQSIGQLDNALKRAGTSYGDLRGKIDEQVDAMVRLGFSDDEAFDALQRMVTLSGDAVGAIGNLGIVADLARDQHIGLADAGELVGKAMAGNTTQLTKMFPALKGSTDLVRDLGRLLQDTAATHAKTFGGSLEVLAKKFDEFKEKVGVAILSGGDFGGVTSGLADILGNLAKWVEKNQDAIAVFTGAVFNAIGAVVDVASAVWDVLGPPLKWLAGVAFVAIIGGLNTLELGLKRTAATFQEFAGTALEAIGNVVEKGGKILKLFGVDVVASTGTALREFGTKLHAEGIAANAQAVTDFKASMGKLGTIIKGGEKDHTEAVRTGAAARTVIRQQEARDATASHLDMEIARQKATDEANKLLAQTAELLKKQNLKQYADQWEAIDRNVRKVKGDLSDTLPPADQLKKSIEENEAAMKKNAAAAKDNKNTIAETVGEATQMGRAFIDAGQAAGVLSAEAASALNSVLNMATSLAEFGLGSVQGVIGVVSALANILSGIGDGPAAKAVRQNTVALDRLTREVGNLNLSATGKTFQGTEAALQATLKKLQAGDFGHGNAETRGQLATQFFRQQLIAQGVSRADAEAMLKELGFGDVFASPQAFAQSLPQLVQGLNKTEFGQFGQDFESQLKALQDSFDIFGQGEDKAAQLGGLSALAKKFSPGITSALGSADPENALKGLFNQLITGTLDPEAFGDLNGEQFLELIKLLLPLVGASPNGPVIAPEGTKTPKINDLLGGNPNLPPTVPPRSPIGDPSSLLGQLLGTIAAPFPVDLGAPTIPPLGVRSKLTGGGGSDFSSFGHFEQKIGQVVQGDLNINQQITPRDTLDPQEIADIVRRVMADSYTLQRSSLGLG